MKVALCVMALSLQWASSRRLSTRKRGLESKDTKAFARELLGHENVAALLDGGSFSFTTAPTGRPTLPAIVPTPTPTVPPPTLSPPTTETSPPSPGPAPTEPPSARPSTPSPTVPPPTLSPPTTETSPPSPGPAPTEPPSQRPVPPTPSPSTATPSERPVPPTPIPSTATPSERPVPPTPSPSTATPSERPIPPTPSPSTATPTPKPVKPSPAPSTEFPTFGPTEEIAIPTPQPSVETSSPTKERSPTSGGGCETTYAYCPGISTCFIGDVYTNGPWGWSINLTGIDFSTTTLTCPIYRGAAQCVISEYKLVGALTISLNSVVWSLSGYEGSSFHLYAGVCKANDAGNHLSTEECDADDMKQFARVPGKYSLVAEPNKPAELFKFNSTNQASYRKGNWKNYNVFPLTQDPLYMSAHATVCPCEGGDCITTRSRVERSEPSSDSADCETTKDSGLRARP